MDLDYIPYCAKYYYNNGNHLSIKGNEFLNKGEISFYYYRGCSSHKCGHNNRLRVPIIKINNITIGLNAFRETGRPIQLRLLSAYKIKPRIIIKQFRKEFGELCILKPNHGIYPNEMQHMTSAYKMRQVIKQIPEYVYKKHIDRHCSMLYMIFNKFIFLPNEITTMIAKFNIVKINY